MIKWTKEKIIEEAKKYKTLKEFSKKNNPACCAARRNNMLSKDLLWLKKEKHEKGYWTKEKIIEECKKYTLLKDLINDNNGLYTKIRKNNWFKYVPWLKKTVHPVGYWTEDKVIEESKKYKSKSEFKFYSQVAYVKARKMKLFDKMPWLNVQNLDKVKDCVYGYFFEDFKTVYIGRTIERRIKVRDKEHRNPQINDIVYRFSVENKIAIPEIKIIESGLTIEEGIKKEIYWEKYYKDNGYDTLNIAKCGSIGGLSHGKWNEKTITEEAKKYKTRTDFKKGNQHAYYSSMKLGLIDTFTWLSNRNKIPKGYWKIKENVFEESKKYNSKSEFSKNCSRAYREARVNNWLKEMEWLNKKKKQ